METLKKTLFHVIELVVILAVVYGVSILFNIESAQINTVIGVVLAALAKMAREDERSPVPDYVNGK